MSAELERATIGELFATGWADRTPVAVPNAQFDPREVEGHWVRLSIAQADNRQIEMCGEQSEHRIIGMVYVQCFGPLGVGDGDLRALADAAGSIFRRRSVSVGTTGRILFRSPTIKDEGSDGKHYQIVMSVPYHYDLLY